MPLDVPELVTPLVPPELDPLDCPEPVDPLDPPEPADPLAAPDPVDPLDVPEVLDPLEAPPLFPHAGSPTVVDAPATTRAWKSFSIFMMHAHYRPRPTQHGSSPQMGVPTVQVCPIGSQQQQPLQSVHATVEAFGLQTDPHDEPSPLLEDPPGLLPPLFPQAASPAVVDAPVTTRTWKSFATFIVRTTIYIDPLLGRLASDLIGLTDGSYVAIRFEQEKAQAAVTFVCQPAYCSWLDLDLPRTPDVTTSRACPWIDQGALND